MEITFLEGVMAEDMKTLLRRGVVSQKAMEATRVPGAPRKTDATLAVEDQHPLEERRSFSPAGTKRRATAAHAAPHAAGDTTPATPRAGKPAKKKKKHPIKKKPKFAQADDVTHPS